MHKNFPTESEELETRFRAMFENAGVGIALVGMDRRPIEANAAMIEMTGYSPEEFFQMSGADLSYPEDAEIGIPELKQVLEGKLNTYHIEKRYVRKADGSPDYFVTMVEDINARKQGLEELHKSH